MKDHPRTRGVYGLGLGIGIETEWIIPAHAGFTAFAICATVMGRDHPRTRGVYGSLSAMSDYYDGSSPHTRGLL